MELKETNQIWEQQTAAAHSLQGLISFAEVALYFNSEEWDLLNPKQRRLYEDVMMDNHENVVSVASIWDQIVRRKEQTQSTEEVRSTVITRSGE